MKTEYNSMYFNEEQFKNGDMARFICVLCDMSYGAGTTTYNEIHIRPADCGAFVIEWAQNPWNHEWGGSFEFVDEDQKVVDIEYEGADRYEGV